MSIGFEILVIALLILANGIFAMSEMAVITARKSRLQDWVNKGNARAKDRAGAGANAQSTPFLGADRHYPHRYPNRCLRRARRGGLAGGIPKGLASS